MKLIVSDFDGTFYDENYLENIEFIKSLKDVDFVIATGRNYESLKKDLKIDCKYYICNDGGYILDNNENVIYKNYMNDNSIKIVYDRMKELNFSKYFFDYVDHFDEDLKPKVNKLSIRKKDDNTYNDMKYMFEGIDDIYGYLSENWINILSIESKKELAIEKIKSNYDEVIVIGNEINDYEMIKKYNGYLINKELKNDENTINNFLDLKGKI